MVVVLVSCTDVIRQDVNSLVKQTQVANMIRVAMCADTVLDGMGQYLRYITINCGGINNIPILTVR